VKAIILLTFTALLLVSSPLAASAQSNSDDCAAVRQTRAFAQGQGLDSLDLERLERRACRTFRQERRTRHERRGRRHRRDRHEMQEANDTEACQTLTLMESFATLAGDELAAAEVVGARRAVCRGDYGEGALRWANGSYLRTSGGTYYWPNGAYARTSGGTYYYPGGAYARTSGGTWYYPNGAYARTGRSYYTASGSRFDSAQSAMLYACQRMPDICRQPRRGDGVVAEVSLVAMLWLAG